MTRAKRLIVVRFRAARNMWELDYRDRNGRRRRPLFPTETAALEEAAKIRKDLEEALPALEDPDVTLAEYARRWLEGPGRDLEDATRASYSRLLGRHVLPALGHLPVRRLDRRHVKALLAGLRAARRGPEGRGYSKNTVRLVKAALSTVLSDAVDSGYLPANPAFAAGRQRGRRAESMTQAERLARIRPLTWEERDAFLAAARAAGPRYGALFSILTLAGLRPSEAFALRPEDVDLTARVLTVTRALDLRGRPKATKTGASRHVHLTPGLADTLRKYIGWLRAEALRKGTGAPTLLFTRPDGAPMDPGHAGYIFKRLLRQAAITTPHRLYDCRHTYASTLLAEGAPITYVSEQIGHVNPAITLKYYARWIPTRGQRWVDRLDAPARGADAAPDRAAGSLRGAPEAILEPESGTNSEAVSASA